MLVKSGQDYQSTVQKFMWNNLSIASKNDKITHFYYGFAEYFMDFEDAITVRFQTNYE